MLKKALFALLALAIPHAAIAQTQLNLQTQVKNTLPVVNGGTGTTTSTGSGAVVLATSPTLTTPLFSTSATITAGTNAQGQAPLTADINVITTTAANPSGVTLPTAAAGKVVSIINSGTNPVNLYPASGATIDALGTNNPIQIQVGGSIEVQATSSTQWLSKLHIDASNTTVLATNGTASTSLAQRFWHTYNVVDDGGLKCNGATNDTTAWTAVVARIAAATIPAPVVLRFPGTCIINAGNYVIPGQVSFDGMGYGGIKLAASQTLTGQLLKFTTTKYTYVTGFILDLNHAVPSSVATALYYSQGNPIVTHSQVLNLGTVTSGNGLLAIQAISTTSCEFSYNTFTSDAPSIYQSKGLNLGQTGLPINNCLIIGNVSQGVSFSMFVGNNVKIIGNEIYGWNFGGGIVLANGALSTDVTDHNIVISGNNIHDSMTVPDSNATYVAGVENWLYGTQIVGNTFRNTCGNGIMMGAKAYVIGNKISNSGTCANTLYNEAGILAATNGGTGVSGAKSFVDGNTVFDDAGTTSYGYADSGISSIGVVLGVNNFQGTLGSYWIAGDSQFSSPQIDNRVVNPCGAFNQRLESTSAVSSSGIFIADQWNITQPSTNLSVGAAPATVSQCQSALFANVATSTTPSASDQAFFKQQIGQNDIYDFRYGTILANSAIFSFCVQSSVTPYVGSAVVQNKPASYSYVVNYNYTLSAGTTQCFEYRIPGDQAHGLGSAPANPGFVVVFDLGTGATGKTSTLNQWTAGLLYGSSTATPWVSQANGSSLLISDVRLLPASADQGWLQRTPSQELANVLRFYQKSFLSGTAPAQSTGTSGSYCASGSAGAYPNIRISLPSLWSSPVVTTYNPSAANANWRDTTASSDITASVPTIGKSAGGFTITSSGGLASAGNLACIHWTADAGL